VSKSPPGNCKYFPILFCAAVFLPLSDPFRPLRKLHCENTTVVEFFLRSIFFTLVYPSGEDSTQLGASRLCIGWSILAVDSTVFLLYSNTMATWHISIVDTLDSLGSHGSRYTPALQALIMLSVSRQFESLGFTVRNLPESVQPAISVSHASEGAVTLYLLRYSSDSIVIQRMV
jgi:hypothetical protein